MRRWQKLNACIREAGTTWSRLCPFLELLRGQGRERATAWLADHSHGVGRRLTVDVKQWFA